MKSKDKENVGRHNAMRWDGKNLLQKFGVCGRMLSCKFDSIAFVALRVRVKPQISTERAAIWRMRRPWRISSRDFFQGFCGPHSESGWGMRPFFSRPQFERA